MSIVAPRLLQSVTVAASPAAAAETAVCTVKGITSRGGSGSVSLSGAVDLSIGTAGTAVTLRIRRGDTTAGTAVATAGPFTVTATDRYPLQVEGLDAPGEIAGQDYTLTVQVTSATAASTVNAASLSALY